MARTERRWRAQRIAGETAARLRPAVLRLLGTADSVEENAIVQAGCTWAIDDAYQRRGVEHLGMDRQEFHLWVHDQIVRPPVDGDDERIDPPVC